MTEAEKGRDLRGRTEDELRAELGEDVYRIVRQKGTERAFTGKYWNCEVDGTYRCVLCGNPLFSSSTKYDSGSGWPSFYQPVEEGKVETEVDDSLHMQRTEVLCAQCHAHLGHVFPDGPAPTGLRYCINSASLSLDEGK